MKLSEVLIGMADTLDAAIQDMRNGDGDPLLVIEITANTLRELGEANK